MKTRFGWTLASAMLVGTMGAAVAADMPLKAPPPVVPIFSWTGCYVGGNIGGKSAHTGDRVTIPAATGPGGATPVGIYDFGNNDDGTFIGGGQVGCNWQTGKLVVGIEGDVDAQRWTRTSVIPNVAVLPFGFVPGDTFELRSNWQASIRGRIGYAWDRNLFYVTGGVAFTDVRANTNWIAIGIFPQVLASDTKDLVGGTIGAGFEHMFTNNFSVGVEGRYTWYGNQNFNSGILPVQALIGAGPPAFTTSPTFRSVHVETGEVMLKANYHFGGPVVARY